MDDKDVTTLLQKVNRNLRVTKVVATRSVKGPRGDNFAGFAACYDSVQDEPAGTGKDLLDVLDEGNDPPAGGMTLREARIAFYLVARQADISATEAALANSSISSQQASDMIAAIKNNYGKLIRRAVMRDEKTPTTNQ